MKNFRKIVLCVFCLSLLAIGSGYLYIHFYGLKLIEQALKSSIDREMAIGKMSYHFPFGVRANDVFVKDLLQVKSINAQLDPLSVIIKKVRLSTLELEQPVFLIGATLHEPKSQGFPAGLNNEHGPEEPQKVTRSTVAVFIKKLLIKNGQLKLNNPDLAGDFMINLNDLQAKAFDVNLPAGLERTRFAMQSLLSEDSDLFAGYPVVASGWFDAHEKDMTAQLNLNDLSGNTMVNAQIVSVNNDLSVNGQIKLAGVTQERLAAINKDSSSLDRIVISLLTATESSVGAEFSFKTKMDDFKVNTIAFGGVVETNSVAE